MILAFRLDSAFLILYHASSMNEDINPKQKTFNIIPDLIFSYKALFIVIALCMMASGWAYARGGQILLPRIPYYLAGGCISFAICVIARKYQKNGFIYTNTGRLAFHQKNKRGLYKLITIGSLTYISLAMLLYCSWFKGDDYAFFHEGGVAERLSIWWQSYLTWVSRSGEFLAHLVGVSQNRWEVFLLVPLFVILSPIFFFKLVTNPTQSLCSTKGVHFYVLSISLLLLSTKLNAWRIFYCFAASMNYLFPCISAVLFLSFYNPARWNNIEGNTMRGNVRRSLAVLVLGIYTCWGGESLALMLLVLMFIWFTYRMRRHLFIPVQCWMGFIGTVIGATLLFAAPALKFRSQNDAKARILDITEMSSEQIHHFVTNLSWEQVNLLKGSSSVIILDGIPLWQHVHFLPYLLERYVECSVYILSILLVFGLLAFFNTKKSKLDIYVITGTLAISLFSACAYLYSCIPTPMSFAPATISLIGAISYIYWNSRISVKKLRLVTIVVFSIALFHLVPAGIEAWQYKSYEKIRFNEIDQQKSRGVQDIILPPAYPSPPVDPLGLIKQSDLKEDPTAYPNIMAPKVLHVKSVSKLPCK